jgi:hypothetical protein
MQGVWLLAGSAAVFQAFLTALCGFAVAKQGGLQGLKQCLPINVAIQSEGGSLALRVGIQHQTL